MRTSTEMEEAKPPLSGAVSPSSATALPTVVTPSPVLNNPVREVRPALRMPTVDPAKANFLSVHVNAFVAPFNINQTVTDNSPLYDLEVAADSRLTRGSSAGLLFEVGQGRGSVQFGAIYSKLSYIPTPIRLFVEEAPLPLLDPRTGYTRFQFETLEVPLSYGWVFAESDAWRWTVRANASAVVTTWGDFTVRSGDQPLIDAINEAEDRLANNSTAPGAEGAGRGALEPTAAQRRQLTNPEPGFLEGGDFLDNTNLYLGGSLVVERLLTPRASVYFSPAFSRLVYFGREEDGIGPYRDRIHTGHLRFGVRYRLTRR